MGSMYEMVVTLLNGERVVIDRCPDLRVLDRRIREIRWGENGVPLALPSCSHRTVDIVRDGRVLGRVPRGKLRGES